MERKSSALALPELNSEPSLQIVRAESRLPSWSGQRPHLYIVQVIQAQAGEEDYILYFAVL
jgi:hypothetical protein